MGAPYYQDDTVRLFHGDCLDVLTELPDASVDAVVTETGWASVGVRRYPYLASVGVCG
jgi:predicted methyltransferase